MERPCPGDSNDPLDTRQPGLQGPESDCQLHTYNNNLKHEISGIIVNIQWANEPRVYSVACFITYIEYFNTISKSRVLVRDLLPLPASHSPAGTERPSWSQYMPARQAWQSPIVTRPVWLLKFPAKQGY